MIIIYSEQEMLNKPTRNCVKLYPAESINIGITGVIVANYSLESKYIYSNEVNLKSSMKINNIPIQEEDLK